MSNNYHNNSERLKSSSFGGLPLSTFERSRTMNRKRILKSSSSSSSSSSLSNEIDDDVLNRKRKVRSLYGDNIAMAGFDVCIQNKEINEKAMDALPIGLPGSGMSLLSTLFDNNCEFPSPLSSLSSLSSSKMKQEWKYLSAKLWNEENLKNSSSSALIPVVIIQDPLQWLYTICTSTSSSSSLHHPELDILWHKAKDRCPNIVANSYDIGFYSSNTVDVQMRWNNFNNTTQSSKSLIDLWSDYYNEWLELLLSKEEQYSHHKLLIIRLEDLLFHNQKLLISNICACSGGTLVNNNNDYQSIKNPSYVNATKLDLVDATLQLATQRYASIKHRSKYLVHECDVDYVKDVLDGKSRELMKRFQYSNKIIDHFDLFKRSPLGLFQLNQL